MSDLENMLEVTDENVQPEAGVVAGSGDNTATPQAVDTEHVEFVIEDEGHQEEKPNNFDDVKKRRAAFAKKEAQRKSERDARLKAEDEARRLREELDAVRGDVNNIKRGPRPDPYDYASTDEFYAVLDKWNGATTSNPTPNAQSQAPQQEAKAPVINQSYEAEFDYNENANALKKGSINDFDEKESIVREELTQRGYNPDDVLNQFKKIASDGDIKGANAVYMIGRNPKVLDELSQCATEVQMLKVLRREAKKLKPQAKKPLNSTPEPNINSSGPIDNNTAAVKKAMDKYAETGNIQDFKALQAAKKAAKS